MVKDAFHEAFYCESKPAVELCIDNNYNKSAMILLYCLIDAMAAIINVKEFKTTRSEFIRWCDKYLNFGKELSIPSKVIYGSRCGLVHSSVIESDIGEKDGFHGIVPGLRENPGPRIEAVKIPGYGISYLTDIKFLKEIIYNGVNQTYIDLYKDDTVRIETEKRLKSIVVSCDLPVLPQRDLTSR